MTLGKRQAKNLKSLFAVSTVALPCLSNGLCAPMKVLRADALPLQAWTHWGLSPGPSACGADVIPLHHVPLASWLWPLLNMFSWGQQQETSSFLRSKFPPWLQLLLLHFLVSGEERLEGVF